MKIIKDIPKIKKTQIINCNNYTGCGSDSDTPCGSSISN